MGSWVCIAQLYGFLAFRVYCVWGTDGCLSVDCLPVLVSPSIAVQAGLFNYARQPPDVIQETFTNSDSPTTSVTAVGFR